MNKYIIAFLAAVFVSPQSLVAQNATCSAAGASQKINSTIARAGTFANLRKTSDSLAAQSDLMIKEALQKSTEINPDSIGCKAACNLLENPLVSFSAVPTKLLTDYSDKQKCESYYTQTKASPHTWKNLTFKTPEEIIALFSDLSQGKGVQGKELYTKCDGSCSPQYKIEISRKAENLYATNVFAVCGPARDKDDDTYTLTSGLSWKCE